MDAIPEDRPLSPEELALARWLLAHGTLAAGGYLDDLARARVASRCGCGCASIDFAVDGHKPPRDAPLEVLADYQWRDGAGHLGGVFIFARAGVLAGLEVWSIDGEAAIDRLPSPAQLEPLNGAPAI
jgi:hypothetical protein